MLPWWSIRWRGGYHPEAITLKRSGAGKVIYVGTSLTAAGQDLLMSRALAEAGLPPGVPSPENVEIIRRVQHGRDYWFILNHNATPCEIQLPASGIDVITNRNLAGTICWNMEKGF